MTMTHDLNREDLLLERERLVVRLEERKARGPDGRSMAALRFFNEDLTSIAKQIVKIDRKLGRA